MRKMQAVPRLDEKTGLVSHEYKEVSDIELKRIQKDVLIRQTEICSIKRQECITKVNNLKNLQ